MIGVIPDVLLERVDLGTLERYRDARLREGTATNTVGVELGVLRMAWRWGRELGACPARELPRVRLKVKPVRNRRTPTPGDVAEVVAVMDGWPRLAVLLLWATGARVGEVASLRWGDIDFDAGVLNLAGKTGARPVPVADHVLDELRAWGPGAAHAGVFGVLARTVAGQLRVRYLPRACRQAEVARFTPHGLRRAAVDALLRAGVDVGTAAALLGHSPKVMLEHYRRATMDDRREAVVRARLGALPAGSVLPLSRRNTPR